MSAMLHAGPAPSNFSDFTDLEVLFTGRRSRIYRARRRRDGQRVVLKVLPDDYPSPSETARLAREHAITASVDVPHVIGCYELVEIAESQAMVLEDIGAASLADVLAEGALTLPEALEVGRKIAVALAGIHDRHVVHKDINPSNVLYRRETGEVRVIDFGIALTLDRERPASPHVGSLEGTLAYMSPEQTGRTNRVLDRRSDLYSLGVTLYECLTGRRPFHSEDPLELLHMQLALAPTPPHRVDPAIPEVVSQLVMKLLHKDAEDRYQTARGVERDLAHCLAELEAKGTIPTFALGRRDVVTELSVPEKLYGRRRDIDALEAAFDEAARGNMRVVVVRGDPGIGKTSLLRSLHRRVGHRRGSFAGAKFGQLERERPLRALLAALRQVLRQLLTEPEERLEATRARLAAKLGGMAAVAVPVLPELERLLGPQPPLAALPPAEDEHRFLTAISWLVQALASRESPLVLVLDDLQWADAASLRLVERLATHPDSNYLLIVGAFRDNEVPASHPTTICLDAIARAGVPVDDIHLGRLSEAHVRELLVDALRLPREQSASLSELAAICQDKTHANPFFLRQFLQDLHTDGLINWSDEVGHFTWDDGAIADAAVTDNVVDYLAARVRRLDLRERDLLRLAAALGTTFDLEAVAAVAPDLDHDWEAAVASAVRFGLVLPLGRGESTPRSGTEVRAARRFVFSHDRVQQAAYDLTPEPDRPRLHLAIGRSLQSALSDADDGQLFEVVEHLNRGLEVMTDPEERAEVAALDRRAGVLALRSAAPREALGFFQHALGALASNAWSADYRGTLSLHELACEAALLSGEEGTMRSLAATVAERARDALDTVAVKEIGIAQRKSVRDLAGAVEESLALLAELGVTFSQSTSDVVVLRELVRTKIALRGKAMAALEALPVLTDPRREAAMRVLGTLLPAAYYVRPGLLPFITFELVRMSVEHGVTPTSAYGFSVYGLLLCTLGDHEQGYAVGAMAVRLGERLGDPRLHNVSLHLFQAHIRFWREPLRACADVEREVHRMGVELGDYEYAAFGAMMHCNMSVFTGDPLERVRETHRIYGAAVGTLQQQTSQQQHAMTAQLVDNLILPDAGGAALKGPHYDESVMLAQLEADGDATLLYVHHAVKLVLAVFFADAATAKTHREALARYAKAAASSIWTFVGESYALLAELMLLHPPASARGRELRGPRRAAALLSVMRGRLRLAKWARGCPANFAHRLALVDAEIARVRGRHGEAMEAYGRAFELARAAGLSGDEGLACELAARFYESIDQAVAARAHLARARYAYGRWGAGAKVARLDRELARSKKVPGEASQASPTTFHTTLRASDAQIDLAAVMRAARAISEPVVVEELLERLMQTLVESAGAQRGVLVLLVDGEARVEAVAESKKEIRVGPPVPLSDFDEASEPVIRYVLRMEEPLVIADARDPGDFHDDRYLARGRTRSVLCVPIVGQGRPLAAVYLENNLSADAFTPARTEVVSMLASQAAVSLENARLYAVLDHKVKQRTAELELRNRFIRETFGRYLSDKVVDSLLQSPEGLAMGGETRTVTVLMADLRGFIAKTQGLPPERVVQLVNVFLSAMTEVILRHGGTIDEFIGDAILVIFGAPVLGEDDASRAVRCALEMQREMVAVNEQNRALGLPEVEMGIGLSTGEVVVGNIGSERRAKYGVVGATVNLASRIESFTRGGDILLPDSTKASLDYDLVITASFEVTLKGHARPVALHRVVGIAGEPETLLSPRTAPLTRLPRPLEVSYRRVAENTLSAQSLRGRIVALSRDRAAIEAEQEEAAFRDLCLRLGEHDVYAKVEPPDEAREATFVVWFTSVDPQARALVEAQLGARDD